MHHRPREYLTWVHGILMCWRYKVNQKVKYMSKFNYKEQHAVIVKCSSEVEQKEVFDRLKKMGFNDLKVVSV